MAHYVQCESVENCKNVYKKCDGCSRNSIRIIQSDNFKLKEK